MTDQVSAQLDEAFLHGLFGLLTPEMPLPPLQQPELLLGIKHLAHFPRQGHRIDGLAG